MTKKLESVQQAANATTVSPTGALSTAVDRISFAHDIVMMTDDAIAIGLGVEAQVNRKTHSSPPHVGEHSTRIFTSSLWSACNQTMLTCVECVSSYLCAQCTPLDVQANRRIHFMKP